MSSIRNYQDGSYSMIELTEESTGSSISFAPERGAIITSFKSGGVELFYMDRDTFLDRKANVRGGNPILFPISGQLEDGRYVLDGVEYAMKNHGLARISPWTVEETGIRDGGAPYARLQLRSTEEMQASYPFAFELEFTYSLVEGSLIIEQSYRNLSDKRMPMYPGFHPYFATPVKELVYETDATRYLDYNDGQEKSFGGTFDIGPLKESIVLTDAKEPRIAFRLPAIERKIVMEYSELFRYVVLWTAEGKDFVCVEPWMAPTGELNRGSQLVWVEPGQSVEATLAIRSIRE